DPPQEKNKRWIGINQEKANAYVGFFLAEGLLPRLFGPVASLKREVKLGGSRLDFLVNDRDYLEVKTPLRDIPCEGHPSYEKSPSKFTGYERLVKHFRDISSLKGGARAVVLLCYMYDAPPFTVPEPRERAIVEAARKATAGGVEHWQANLELDEAGVGLTRYFRLELF
ncbi:MAG TPA: DNA/RNA nuclease SfsA, partial [Methanocella sp.]|nr:DNA/RNA nuclease SfsA [Methanocella sp.]